MQMTVVVERSVPGASVLDVVGPLRGPVSLALRRRVGALLRRGERSILVDLARVTDLDAAGLGELAHVYRMVDAANGVLRVACTTGKVRKLLGLTGLLQVLTAASMFDYQMCS